MRDLARILASLSAILLLTGRCAAAEGSDSQEYPIKAAYVYNFAKFVEWPAEPARADSDFSIGIVGRDPFGPLIDEAVAGKSADGRRIVVERFADVAALCRSPRPASLLFIGEMPPDSVARALACVAEKPVLTIGEAPGFCENGGIINFVVRKNRVRFEINPRAASRAELKISSKLMQLGVKANEKE